MKAEKHTNSLPTWLTEEETVTFPASKSPHFLQLNLQTIISLLDRFRENQPKATAKTSPVVRFLHLLAMIVLILESYHFVILWIIGLVLLFHVSHLPGQEIIRTFKTLGKLLFWSALVLVPSLLMNHQMDLALFLMRVSLLLLNLSVFLAMTSWSQLLTALEQLRVPSIIVLTLDITIKYCYILGDYIKQVLYAIKLKTLGQRPNKKIFGAILGMTYLSTKHHTRELYQAMTLRGYGTFKKKKISYHLTRFDALPILEIIALVICQIMIR